MGSSTEANKHSLLRVLLLLVFVALPFCNLWGDDSALNLTPDEIAWLQAHKTLRIGITPDWPPFEFIDEKGNYHGLSADFLRMVLKRLGIGLEIASVTDPWNTVLRKLRDKELDGVASIFISEGRQGYINFTQPYVDVPHVVIVRDRGETFSSMQELGGRRLAYMRGWVCQELIERDYPEIVLSLNDTIEGMIGQVLLGTADAGLIDLASLGYYSQRHNLSGLRVTIKSPYSPRLAFGFPKDDTVAAGLFNKIIRAIPEKELDEIREKWLRGPDETAIKIRLALHGLAVLALIAFLILAWNLQLRRRVKERTTALEKEMEQNRLQAYALRESEAKLRAFFDQTMQFIGLLSTHGILLDANLSALQMIDVSAENVVNRYFWDTPWWSHSVEMQEKLKNAVERATAGEIVRFESTHYDAHGKLRYVDFSLKRLWISLEK